MQPADGVFVPTTFTHNRKRLDTHGLTATFFAAVVGEAVAAGLCRDHFTHDGTSIKSGAALKSFRPAEGGDKPKEQPRCSVPC
ncbi:hypothetical protein J0H58_26785 [bacterium]|nr:hypothetical protein [bacterium]